MARSPKANWLTIEETALTLGVSLDGIRRLRRENKLPGRKKGRRWRISATAVCVFTQGGRENAMPPTKWIGAALEARTRNSVVGN